MLLRERLAQLARILPDLLFVPKCTCPWHTVKSIFYKYTLLYWKKQGFGGVTTIYRKKYSPLGHMLAYAGICPRMPPYAIV
jgi:hypothetical protein